MLLRRALIGSIVTAVVLAAGACVPDHPDEPVEEADGNDHGLAPAEHRALHVRTGNYNIQWFGSVEDGPDDEPLQLERAAEVMRQSDVDIWVLCEIVHAGQFEALVAALPGYEGFIANDPVVEGGAQHYGTYEQKLAIVHRAGNVTVRSPRVILPSHAYDFGSRPPLAMEVTLENAADRPSFTLVGLHMKAMSDAQSYERRKRSAAALHGFLDAELGAGRSVLVLGDWNDDIDHSIASGKASPFLALAGDADYRFLTKELSLAGVGSRTTGSSFIDHQLVGGALEARHVEGSTERVEADEMVPAYGTTTSDHFPIVSTFEIEAAGSLLINEVLVNEPGSDTAHELVEIVATDCAGTDLTGFSLHVDGNEVFRFPDGARLEPGESVVVYGRQRAIPAGATSAFAASGLGLKNGGGEVALVDPEGAVVSEVSFATSKDGVSLTRAIDADPNADFVPHPALQGRFASPGTPAAGGTFASRCN